ncbi:MAG: ribonuclease H-like domain-containing protein, partial [Syntrophaceae bacterium]|nr:ribonuclease H-like domain-containing protein [Syntrophaceae bacterium]
TPKQLGKVVIFDLETQMLADEVGGWSNISKMMLSLAVTYSDQDGYQTFTEKNVDALINNLITADMVVGFNHVSFDYVVLSAYTSQNLKSLNNLDILLEAKTRIGFRLSLNHLAEHTLGIKKSGSGLDAARWFKQGKMDLIEKYCRDDVRITKELYEYGRDRGHVLYSNKGSLTRINVDWP